MIGAILGGIGAAAELGSILTRKNPTYENIALGSDGTQGAGAIASRRFAEDRVDRTGLSTQLANNDIANSTKAFEQNALAQGNLANQQAQRAIAGMKRQVNESGASAGLSAAQRAGVNSSLTQNLSGMLQNQAQTNTQTGQQIAGLQMNAAQQQLGNTMNEKAFDQSRLPQIQWQQRLSPADNRLSDALGAVGSLAGAASGGAFGDLDGGAKGIRSDPSLTNAMPPPPDQANMKVPDVSGLLAQQNANMKIGQNYRQISPTAIQTNQNPYNDAYRSDLIGQLRQKYPNF